MNGVRFDIERKISGPGDFPSTRLDKLTELKTNESGEAAAGGEAKSFGDYMKQLVQDSNESQLSADKKMEEVAVGRSQDLHGAVLAMEKADINFKLLTQVRNKVIDAYREIMRMQV